MIDFPVIEPYLAQPDTFVLFNGQKVRTSAADELCSNIRAMYKKAKRELHLSETLAEQEAWGHFVEELESQEYRYILEGTYTETQDMTYYETYFWEGKESSSLDGVSKDVWLKIQSFNIRMKVALKMKEEDASYTIS